MQQLRDEKQSCKEKLGLVHGWQHWLVKEHLTQNHNARALGEWALELEGATPTFGGGGLLLGYTCGDVGVTGFAFILLKKKISKYEVSEKPFLKESQNNRGLGKLWFCI